MAAAMNKCTRMLVVPRYLRFASNTTKEMNLECQLGFLGTVSAGPTRSRGASSVIINWTGTSFLIDCGESTARQLGYTSTPPAKIAGIFITHMHGDHLFGLPTMILQISEASLQTKQVNKSRDKCNEDDHCIKIYGPPGIYNFVCSALKYSRSSLACNIEVYELISNNNPIRNTSTVTGVQGGIESDNELSSRDMLPKQRSQLTFSERPVRELKIRNITRIEIESDPNDMSCWQLSSFQKPSSSEKGNGVMISVKAVAILHSIPCFGFVFEEESFEGSIDVEKTIALGLHPCKEYKLLKKGLDVTLENGTVIKSSDVVSPRLRGRKLVVLGDTCDASNMVKHAQDCDLLVHEATVEVGDEQAKLMGHSTPKMAGEMAHQVNAKRLALTHFSKKLDHGDNDPNPTLIDWTLPIMNPPIQYVNASQLRPLEDENQVIIKPIPQKMDLKKIRKPKHHYTTENHVKIAARAFKKEAVLGAKDFMFITVPRGGFIK